MLQKCHRRSWSRLPVLPFSVRPEATCKNNTQSAKVAARIPVASVRPITGPITNEVCVRTSANSA